MMKKYEYANDEMKAVYGIDREHRCAACENREGNVCTKTNGKRKCSSYGDACGKYVERKRI